MAFLERQELEDMGFRHLGRDVKVSDKVSIYNPGAIDIGDFSRIDDFCVLSAGADGISIGRNVHIAIFCSLIGASRIEMHDFSGISSRVSIYSSNDDYSGKTMTNPTVPDRFKEVRRAPVVLCKHVIVGSGAIILPGVTMGSGSVAGALSLIRGDCESFGVYAGNPARRIGARSNRLLDLEVEFLSGEFDR